MSQATSATDPYNSLPQPPLRRPLWTPGLLSRLYEATGLSDAPMSEVLEFCLDRLNEEIRYRIHCPKPVSSAWRTLFDLRDLDPEIRDFLSSPTLADDPELEVLDLARRHCALAAIQRLPHEQRWIATCKIASDWWRHDDYRSEWAEQSTNAWERRLRALAV